MYGLSKNRAIIRKVVANLQNRKKAAGKEKPTIAAVNGDRKTASQKTPP